MTVGELIAQLEAYDEDQEVRIMSQPSWPFEYSIAGVVAGDEIESEDRDGNSRGFYQEEAEATVFLTEGTQLGYGTKWAW